MDFINSLMFAETFPLVFNEYTEYLANCLSNNLPVVSFLEWLKNDINNLKSTDDSGRK